MSAGNNGAGMPPEHDDDPFASLYRSEGDEPGRPAQPPPRQTSYHQVRPVGERTYAVQRPPAPQGYRQPQPDAYYAAPETRPGGGAGPAGPGRRRAPAPEPPRRNGLLIGAIAVVLAVVVGIGAAILFSSDGEKEQPGGDATGTSQGATGGSGDNGGTRPSEDEETPPEAPPEELPAADLAALDLAGTVLLETNGTVTGASSPDGSYLTGFSPGASLTWTFELTGEARQYHLYTSYTTVTDDQTLSFSVNGEPRDDPINLKDYATGTDDWNDSWVTTWNLVDLGPGTNTITMSCTDSCGALIDQIYLTTERE